MAGPATIHGTAVAIRSGSVGAEAAVAWKAALIRGPSGSGKSDLALRCLGLAPGGLITEPARLVADDRVIVSGRGACAVVSSPLTLQNRLEVRGVGIVDVPAIPSATLALLVDLVTASSIERMPAATFELIEGVRIAILRLAPFEGASALKLLLCLQQAKA